MHQFGSRFITPLNTRLITLIIAVTTLLNMWLMTDFTTLWYLGLRSPSPTVAYLIGFSIVLNLVGLIAICGLVWRQNWGWRLIVAFYSYLIFSYVLSQIIHVSMYQKPDNTIYILPYLIACAILQMLCNPFIIDYCRATTTKLVSHIIIFSAIAFLIQLPLLFRFL